MTALNKKALREEFQYMQRHYSDPADRDRQLIYIAAEALLDELEKEKGYASAYEGEKWHYHQLAESEGERADRAEVKLEAAEKRIAEQNETLMAARIYVKSHAAGDGHAFGVLQAIDRAAGIRVKGE